MKNKFFSVLVALVLLSAIFAVGCDFGFGSPTSRDYNADIQAVSPENINAEHFIAEEGTTYYTSKGFSLWMEVNGEFLEMDYFSLDGTKRVYDNLFFYVGDYFYMITDDVKYLYASLGDNADLEYAEEEKESGEDIQINVKKAGIYKLIFDVETLKFDMEYKSEIQTPKYYTIKNCSIYSVATEWKGMSVNTENEDEFVIKNFNIDANKFISFFNNLHTSNYKVTLDSSCDGKFAMANKTTVTVNVGGDYNIYINRKTYVVRLELCNIETATYSLVYYDGNDFIELSPYEEDVPYVFHKQLVVDTKYTTSLPKFHTSAYRTYNLTVEDASNLLMGSEGEYTFKKAGTYNLIINLKEFKITVELLPE